MIFSKLMSGRFDFFFFPSPMSLRVELHFGPMNLEGNMQCLELLPEPLSFSFYAEQNSRSDMQIALLKVFPFHCGNHRQQV